MPKGVELVDLHSPLVFIDGLGNLVLNTQNKLAEQIAAGNTPGLVGPGIGTGIAISNAASTTNVSNVSFQLTDSLGVPLAKIAIFDIFLSDAASGLGLTATTASGGIAAAASGGVVMDILTAAKMLRVQTTAAGLFKLAITDTAKTGFFPAAQLSTLGIIVGAALTSASYG